MTNAIPANRLAAIVLCGGQSQRMGFAKWNLPIGVNESFLDRIVESIQNRVGLVVAVHGFDGPLPERDGIQLVRDRNPNRGPMEGIACGLAALPEAFEAAFVTSCDVPLLQPGIIDVLATQLEDYQAVTPIDQDRIYGLTAVYRRSIASKLDELIENNKLKISTLHQHFRIRQIDIELLKSVDPELASLTNVNTASDYLALVKRIGFQPPEDVLKKLQIPGC